MNILLVHDYQMKDGGATYNAVNYYRMQKPMEVLRRLYPEFDYFTAPSIDVPDTVLNQTDLVLFSRVIPEGSAEKLNKLGLTFGLDLDDYWHLDKDHLLFHHYKENDIPNKIIESIRAAHFVTCTTELLASKIRELNKNVFVIENGIDTEDEVWKPEKVNSDRLRFGFTQGETHIPDLLMVAADVARSFNDLKFYHKAQVVLAGFRVHTEVNKNAVTGQTAVRTGSVQIGYERMLTDDHKALKHFPQYSYELMQLGNPDGRDKPYRRLNSLEVGQFGTVYDEMDIVVAPLVNNSFNNCKSNIKMLEAGFKDCGIMVSSIHPYLPLATKANSYSLNEKNFFEWQKIILRNPNLNEDKKAQLAEDVKPYSLNTLSKKRKEIYEGCRTNIKAPL